MNEYDTELVRAILQKEGYSFVDDELSADIVMLNTCAVRENAYRKVHGRIHAIRHNRQKALEALKKTGDDGSKRFSPDGENPPLIGILGCMATNLRTALLEDRGLDIAFIAGPDSYKRLPALIGECLKAESRTADHAPRKLYDLTLSEFETYSDVYPHREKGANAWIAVMRGCNNFCTFCVVPYTRGRERSRTVENIVEEAGRLADEGFKQVTLLGQNVNSYWDPSRLKEGGVRANEIAGARGDRSTKNGRDFAYLLEEVSKINGIERIRFTSPHPKDFPESLLKVIAENPKVCKHVHLPLQAGSNRVLKAMNRTYTKQEFFTLARRIRALHPDTALSTDIIVGFPTETDRDFQETLEVMEMVRFDSAFMFKYSRRKGTIAEREFKDEIPEHVKTGRIMAVNKLQERISLEMNRREVGKTARILVERKGAPKAPGTIQGRMDNNKLVTVPDRGHSPGDLLAVRITAASPYGLKGEAV